jgi:hypothetical protein
MKRTKPTSKDKKKLNKLPHKEFGGSMPHPPEGCPARKSIGDSGIEYISNSSCCECRWKKDCTRKKEFENEWKEYWRVYKQIKGRYNGEDMVAENGVD